MALYSDIVVDHFENPRNLGEIDSADTLVQIGDPVCGDTIHLAIVFDPSRGRIVDARFRAYGCAPALALGSVLTEQLIGASRPHVSTMDEDALCLLLGGLTPNQRHVSALGLRVLTALDAAWARESRE